MIVNYFREETGYKILTETTTSWIGLEAWSKIKPTFYNGEDMSIMITIYENWTSV